MKRTISSSEASENEKAIIEALHPWPLSNEEAWATARIYLRRERINTLISAKKALSGADYKWLKVIDCLISYEIESVEEEGR